MLIPEYLSIVALHMGLNRIHTTLVHPKAFTFGVSKKSLASDSFPLGLNIEDGSTHGSFSSRGITSTFSVLVSTFVFIVFLALSNSCKLSSLKSPNVEASKLSGYLTGSVCF